MMTLDPRLDLAAARGLARALLERRHTDLTLQASAVRSIGTPALQVLIAAARQWAADGRTLTLADPSHALSSAVTRLDLGAVMPVSSGAAGTA